MSKLRTPEARHRGGKTTKSEAAMDVFQSILGSTPIPPLYKVRQSFPRPRVENVKEELMAKLHGSGLLDKLSKGAKVAITVGSRGISNQPLIVRSLVEELKRRGAEPFIVPAMGSHGGATAAGQRDLLIRMGFGEKAIGAPIRSGMEVVDLGTTQGGYPVFMDRCAYEADGVVVLNRIKPHVSFRGRYESGLMKMIAIGLGKQRGAEACHDAGFGEMAENIYDIARTILDRCNILLGIGLLENPYHETCSIEVLDAGEIAEKEPELQERAKQLQAKLYFSSLDVLIVDEIGKEISGTGMDNNVIGRYTTPYPTGGTKITRIAVLSLTADTHGNANGLGVADFTTRRVFDAFRFDQTYPNSLTSTATASVKIPMVLDSDRLAIRAAIKTCNVPDKQNVRLVRIRNTLKLDEIHVSPALLAEVEGTQDMSLVGEPQAVRFDERGNILPY
jgi:hypothetical protein